MPIKQFLSSVGSIIKSIQRGSVTGVNAAKNVTVTAVVMNKSFVTVSWESTGLSPDRTTGTCILTTTTNLLFSRQEFQQSLAGAWELIEYE